MKNLEWKSETPTEPGLYWRQSRKSVGYSEYSPTLIYRDGNGILYMADTSTSWMPLSDCPSSRWQGPFECVTPEQLKAWEVKVASIDPPISTCQHEWRVMRTPELGEILYCARCERTEGEVDFIKAALECEQLRAEKGQRDPLPPMILGCEKPYEPDAKTLTKLAQTFKYHAPKGSQIDRYAEIRARAYQLAILLHQVCPESRERALAMTNLEQAIFWANASIARNE